MKTLLWYICDLLGRTALILGLQIVILCPSAMAAQRNFFQVCQAYLPQAQNFSQICKLRARLGPRRFNGVPEGLSIYFDDKADSNFGLGCVVGPHGGVSSVGIYYTPTPEIWKISNTTDLRFVDNNGNVGLAEGGKPYSILLIRPFVFGEFKHPMYPARVDCEGAHDGHSNPVPGPHGNFLFSERKSGDFSYVQMCTVSNNAICASDNYIRFPRVSSQERIIFADSNSYLIKADGSVLIKKSLYDRVCSSHSRAAFGLNIVQELCP